MGLDSVELVLAVEEEFAITIEDEDAASLTTPRLLANYVASKLGAMAQRGDRCLSQAGFSRIRSVLTRDFGAKRNEVDLESRIQQFLMGDIRKRWREFGTAIGATQLPRLQCKKPLAYFITFGMPLAGAVLLLLGSAPSWVLAVSIPVLWIAAVAITDRVADVVPSNVSTVRALIPYAGVADKAEWTFEYVLQRVIQITSVQLGIPIEKIGPDHHFVKDLGLD